MSRFVFKGKMFEEQRCVLKKSFIVDIILPLRETYTCLIYRIKVIWSVSTEVTFGATETDDWWVI